MGIGLQTHRAQGFSSLVCGNAGDQLGIGGRNIGLGRGVCQGFLGSLNQGIPQGLLVYPSGGHI